MSGDVTIAFEKKVQKRTGINSTRIASINSTRIAWNGRLALE